MVKSPNAVVTNVPDLIVVLLSRTFAVIILLYKSPEVWIPPKSHMSIFRSLDVSLANATMLLNAKEKSMMKVSNVLIAFFDLIFTLEPLSKIETSLDHQYINKVNFLLLQLMAFPRPKQHYLKYWRPEPFLNRLEHKFWLFQHKPY